jgi:hypothetical protein
VQKDSLNVSFSLTLLIDLTDAENPFAVTIRTNSNTQWDFLEFVIAMIEEKRLVPGDYLVVDNATVHCGSDSWPALHSLLQQQGIQLIYLPKYSPEFNPCELVFAEMKNWLRWHRVQDRPMWVSILEALARISFVSVLAFYWKCTQDL